MAEDDEEHSAKRPSSHQELPGADRFSFPESHGARPNHLGPGASQYQSSIDVAAVPLPSLPSWTTSGHLPSPAVTPTEATCTQAAESVPDEAEVAEEKEGEEDASGEPLHSGRGEPAEQLEWQAADVPDLIAASAEDDKSKPRSRSSTKTATSSHVSHVRRLSASKIQELATAPGSLPIATISDHAITGQALSAGLVEAGRASRHLESSQYISAGELGQVTPGPDGYGPHGRTPHLGRPGVAIRTLSTPPTNRRSSGSHARPGQVTSPRRNSLNPAARPPPLDLDGSTQLPRTAAKLSAVKLPVVTPDHFVGSSATSPVMPPGIPLPPMSVPTLLQLELAGQRPSPLYIYPSRSADMPYESSAVKFERLKNFLLVPIFLERTMTFGTLACLDAWLWTFTILPMRFCTALWVLVLWWAYILDKEIRWLVGFVWYGLGRLWRRGRWARSPPGSELRPSGTGIAEGPRSRSQLRAVGDATPTAGIVATLPSAESQPRAKRQEGQGVQDTNGFAHHIGGPKKVVGKLKSSLLQHRRTGSMPSNLTSFHKADLLQGAIVIVSSVALMNLDASRMYHLVRAQSTLKLYAIYNLIEVGDRLLSALGQDILECLLSSETLSRNSSGRSKVLLPFGMFLLALVYNVGHSVTLFYQVVTLNVAINSYSNALLTLLMSNLVVEIKSSVFKRFEKENTFQLTCADIVERFQLWVILLIIAMRNVVEVGGLSVPGAGKELIGDEDSGSIPLHTATSLPASFTILPPWLWSGEVLSPFLVVIGSEMIVDWIKHAYINKFNNIRHTFYTRALDVLCKDYYTNAFVTPSLTRRLGLPLLPLSCLFIRAAVQTYHMFLAAHVSAPLPPSTQTSLSVESATPSSPAVAAAIDRLDLLIRNALGRAVHGYHVDGGASTETNTLGGRHLWAGWTSDDLIAGATMIIVFFLGFLVLLVIKLLLSMLLLRYSRDRYAGMRAAEHAFATGKVVRESYDMVGSKRAGGQSQVEVGDERRRWIYEEDREGLRKAREKESKAERGSDPAKEKDLSGVSRYEMIARRIW